MNKQTLIILGGGLCFALLVALIMQAMLKPEPSQQPVVAQIETARILVASKDLKIGDSLTQESMKWKNWPEDAVFSGAIHEDEIEAIEGKPPLEGKLIRNVTAGEPLTKSVVAGKSKGNFVAATLEKGMRAMAIKVKAESSVGGFVKPKDRVDVIMTYDVRLPADENVKNAAIGVINKKAAQTILENIRVVAVDQEAKELEKASVGRTVTLEVTPKEAEALALADAMGGLSLVLRQLGDESKITTENNKPTTDIRMSNVMQELIVRSVTGK
jgi:pilus assembly protein CpaB